MFTHLHLGFFVLLFQLTQPKLDSAVESAERNEREARQLAEEAFEHSKCVRCSVSHSNVVFALGLSSRAWWVAAVFLKRRSLRFVVCVRVGTSLPELQRCKRNWKKRRGGHEKCDVQRLQHWMPLLWQRWVIPENLDAKTCSPSCHRLQPQRRQTPRLLCRRPLLPRVVP